MPLRDEENRRQEDGQRQDQCVGLRSQTVPHLGFLETPAIFGLSLLQVSAMLHLVFPQSEDTLGSVRKDLLITFQCLRRWQRSGEVPGEDHLADLLEVQLLQLRALGARRLRLAALVSRRGMFR